jgi:hypothetical protein
VKPSCVLQIFQQVDHLRLDGDVQRRNRFVADDEGGVRGQGAGDADALPLPAGKLVGKRLKETPSTARTSPAVF